MSEYQAESKKKNRYIAIILVLILVLGLMIGGVSAYLSMSSDLTNDFEQAESPSVVVSGTSVTVDPKGYAVYLRVAIDAAWELDGVLLPEEPTAYAVAEDWKEIDGFYYYPGVIKGSDPVTVIPVSYSAATKDGYNLVVHVAAQVVQAVGETDGGMPAVQEAWGVTPTQITG